MQKADLTLNTARVITMDKRQPSAGLVAVKGDRTLSVGAENELAEVIGAGTKIDNLCQIAHNVKIGKNVLMAAQCGISGSTVIGNDVTMGGQAGIADNIEIGDNVIIGAKSAVIGSIEKNSVVWGIPARPIAQTKRQMAVLSWPTKNSATLSKKGVFAIGKIRS